MKPADDLEIQPNHPGFGSHARDVSDLGNPDARFFVQLGGQDGWFGSRVLDDQIPLRSRGESIRLPMLLGANRKLFPIENPFPARQP